MVILQQQPQQAQLQLQFVRQLKAVLPQLQLV
jgi:hypothetical protein